MIKSATSVVAHPVANTRRPTWSATNVEDGWVVGASPLSLVQDLIDWTDVQRAVPVLDELVL